MEDGYHLAKILSVMGLLLKVLDSLLVMIVTYLPGGFGNYLRYRYYKKKLGHLGEGSRIDQGVIIANPKKVSIGDHTWIDKNVIILGDKGVEIGKRVHVAQNCLIQGGGTLKIGDYVSVASGSLVYSATDTVFGGKGTNPMFPPEYRNPVARRRVVLGNHAFVGARTVIILASLGEGSVVGAGSVVTKDISAWKIAVGAPARPIKDRPPVTLKDI
jgi:acetyltransferase-like isoleucine patch superfamily enzyme